MSHDLPGSGRLNKTGGQIKCTAGEAERCPTPMETLMLHWAPATPTPVLGGPGPGFLSSKLDPTSGLLPVLCASVFSAVKWEFREVLRKGKESLRPERRRE